MNRTIRFILFTGILLYCLAWSPASADARSNRLRANATATQTDGIVLKGVVISSADNLPIPGVAVYVKGQTTIGTATDLDGNYSLTVPQDAKYVVFESLGYDHKEIAVHDYLLFTLVTLVEQSHELDEVVVVGFGTQKKESLVGSISAVSPDNLITKSTLLSTSFAGNVAGIISRQTSGEPMDDAATFYIRGVSTFGSNTSPLYVVDGVEVDSKVLDMIPPEAIESFSVLKDATATALYGSRGANGVIIVNTKEGKNSEKMNVTVSVENSFITPTYVQKVADAVTYMELYNEAWYNSSVQAGSEYTPYYSNDKIEGTRQHLNKYIYPDNDWYNMIFKKFTMSQRANVTLKGGSKNLTYFLSAQFTNEGGLTRCPSDSFLDNNLTLQSYSVQSNVTAHVTKTTKVALKMNLQVDDKKTPITRPQTLYGYCLTSNPADFPATFPAEEGDTYVRFGNAHTLNGNDTQTNPYAMLCEGYAKGFYMYATASMEINQKLDFITKGLSATALASFYNYTKAYSDRTITPYYFVLDDDWYVDDDGEYHFTESSIGTEGSTYLTSSVSRDGYHIWTFQGKLNYDRTFKKHSVSADVIWHMRSQTYNSYSADEDYLLPYRQAGLAARVAYNFDRRYYIEGDFGYNGSENFAPGKRWGFFPSVAIGWNLANEPFMSSVKDRLNTFKIRASYGQTGNDELGQRFPYLSEVSMSNRVGYFGTNFASRGTGYVSVWGNEDATWEVANKFDVGFDLELFRSLNLTADYFYEYRYNIFMQRSSLGSLVGLSGTTPYGNLGECDNRGVDLSVNYNKQFNKDLVLQLRGTFTYAHNRVLAMDEPDYSENPNLSKIGHSINSWQLLVAEGIFTSQEEIDNSPYQNFGNYTIGDLKYKDINGDGVIDSNDEVWTDQTSVPEIIYGFGGTVRYKHWDFSLMFQGAGKYWLRIYNADPFISSGKARGVGIMQWVVDDHWSEDNNVANAAYPRLIKEYLANNYQASTWFLRNAAFLRLKSLEVGYTYNFLRVYVSGSNLFVLSPFKLWDPEKGSGNGLSYPQSRQVTIGIQFNF